MNASENSSTNTLLNPALKLPALADTLQEQGFLEVPDFLSHDIAEQIFNCLHNEVQWELAYRDNEQAMVKTYEELLSLSPEQRQDLHQNILTQARNNYQYAYFRYPMLDAYLQKWQPALMLNQILENMNSPETLASLRTLCSDPQLRKTEIQATFYAPGHFLKLHNDNAHSNDDRRYAWVLSLSKDWESQFGGLLQLVDDKQVTQTFTPRFNTCVFFKVPRDHQVSYVAPFATGNRYALTGWVRAD